MLTLQINRRWFDLIRSGVKTEEYRAIKPFNDSRLAHTHDQVLFINGYRKDAPRLIMELKGVRKGFPRKGWCGEEMLGKECWVLELGEVISK